MNPRTLLSVAVAAVAVQAAAAIFGATTIAFTTGTTALTGATYSVAGISTLIAGLALLGGIAKVAKAPLLRGGGRSRGGHHGGGSSRGHHGGGGGGRGRSRYGKREALDVEDVNNEVIEDEDDVERELSVLNLLEPDECFHRLICDLSTGAMPKSPIDFVATMFTGEELVREGSAEYEYALAAQVGRQFRNPRFCELRYQCRLTGQQLVALAAEQYWN